MSKCPNISNTYYSRKELKHSGLEIFSNICDSSTENYTPRLAIIFVLNCFQPTLDTLD